MSVCPSARISVQTSRNFLSVLPVAVAQFSSDDNSIMLCTSGFLDDIMFLHNGLYIWRVSGGIIILQPSVDGFGSGGGVA